jgi:thiol-disulfide isomerase/thioredoxin
MRKPRWQTTLSLLAILALAGCLKPDGGGTVQVGSPAPPFSLSTPDGGKATLADQKGKVVMIDFWATWCPPCRLSLPHVQEISADKDRAASGLVVWAVNDQEDAATITKFLADNKYSFTTPMDTQGTAQSAYGVSGIPTTVIVGRDGMVKNVFVGFSDDLGAQVNAAVDKALAEAPPG